MDTEEQTIPKPYDCFVESKWMFILLGYAQVDTKWFKCYKALILLFNTYYLAMESYALIRYLPTNKDLAIDALNVWICTIWSYWCLGARILTSRYIKQAQDMANEGVYIYKDEAMDEGQLELRRGLKEDVLRKSKFLACIYGSGMTGVMFVFPLVEYLFYRNSERHKGYLSSPYLPHVLYVPFDTESFLGFTLAYLIDIYYWFLCCGSAVATNRIVVSFIVQIRVQLKILNHSLRNIEKRAYYLYAKKYNVSHDKASMADLLQKKEFQHCLNLCLRSNIEHHLALLKFKKACQPYNGWSLLNLFTITVFIYATSLYGLFQKPPLTGVINYAGTFVVEQSHTFLICFSGEEAKQESETLFEVLYDTPWYKYNRDFKRSLHIMLSNTVNPLFVESELLKFSASMDSYGELLSAVYKVMNIWRSSESIQ